MDQTCKKQSLAGFLLNIFAILQTLPVLFPYII